MFDIKLLRSDPHGIEKKLKTKDIDVSIEPIIALDERIRHIKNEVEQLKSTRNQKSKDIGEKKRKGENASSLFDEVSGLGEKISLLDQELSALQKEFHDKLSLLPNIPFDEVKASYKPADNVCIKTMGEKKTFSFASKNHLELNEKLYLFDLPRGAKMSGTGWPVYVGMGARLEWALLNYMLEIHLKNGFEQIMPPLLVNQDTMFGSAQLPKFEHQLFKLTDADYNLYLIPTSEVAINGLYIDEIIPEDKLPLKYIAYTPCFRREAGAAGSGERGLIRTHQFNKVEMFCFTKPEQGTETFDMMLLSAEEVLQGLGLHYKNMLLVTGDMSFPAAKTVDIEVWLPGQDRYYEVSSVSYCTDFQARRSNIRYRHKEEKPEFVHTLNGSGLATSRLMVALLENNQQEDGSVTIPSVLHKYLNNQKTLTPLQQ